MLQDGMQIIVLDGCPTATPISYIMNAIRLRALGNAGKYIVKIKTLMVDRFVIG